MGDVEPRSVRGRTAYIALGSNVGDRAAHLRYAIDRMKAHDGIRIGAVSGVYESEAHTVSGGGAVRPYLNAVAKVETSLAPRGLLAFCLRVERDRGRDRSVEARWAPRTLDMDLLLFDDLRVDEPDLIVPHPRMPERRFVLRPLADVAPNLDVPAPVNATVRELLRDCPDAGTVRRTPYSIVDEEDRRPDPRRR